MKDRLAGIGAALGSAFFLGLAPVFGKQAILFGLPPLAVVALRTGMAALLLFAVMLVFNRQYFYIYPAGLFGCLLAGSINGLGSLLYYTALGRIDASVGQMLYTFYPLFVALWLRLDKQPLGRLTLMRLIFAIPALYLLTKTGHTSVDLIGAGMMLAAAALYALHLPINQRVLFDMPAPTVTFYTLLAMSSIVIPVYWITSHTNPVELAQEAVYPSAWVPLLALTLVTFFSRLMLFLGVKHLGGMQTAILGLGELWITIFFAYWLLGERFSPLQWTGSILLIISLGLIILEKTPTRKTATGGWLSWLRPPVSTDMVWPTEQ